MFENKTGYTIIALIVFSILFLGVGFYGLQETKYWHEHGIQAQGKVIDKYTTEEFNTSTSGGVRSSVTHHYLTYSYSHNEQSYEGKDSVKESLWDTLEKGSDLTLLYSAVQHNKSSVAYASDDIETTKLLFTSVMYLGGFLFLITCVLIYRNNKAQQV